MTHRVQSGIDKFDSYEDVPQRIFDAIKRHVMEGRTVGRFLESVLENVLMEAVFRADEDCEKALRSICMLIYTECPAECWGSREKVAAWREGMRSE